MVNWGIGPFYRFTKLINIATNIHINAFLMAIRKDWKIYSI